MTKLTPDDYSQLAYLLHEALTEHDPTVPEQIPAWNAVRDLIARFCALFDADPEFDYSAFLGIAMNGCPTC